VQPSDRLTLASVSLQITSNSCVGCELQGLQGLQAVAGSMLLCCRTCTSCVGSKSCKQHLYRACVPVHTHHVWEVWAAKSRLLRALGRGYTLLKKLPTFFPQNIS
jgi:hypothetical protein